MEKLLKYFPFLPEERNTEQLIKAIIFYAVVPVIPAVILAFFFMITIILFPLAYCVLALASLYIAAGIFFSIMKFLGKDLDKMFAKKEEEKKENEE